MFTKRRVSQFAKERQFAGGVEPAAGHPMRDVCETWAVVLAGGEGSRLRTLTTTREGLVVPKQYCSLRRPSCLLQDALKRARTVAMPTHVCTVVAAEHRRWWAEAVSDLNDSNVFVQPKNKGTALGILLALLKLQVINPSATVALLPADHYFRNEDTIARILRAACNLASANPRATYLLGSEPDTADTELGYILPAQRVREKPARILGFTEKPTQDYAQELLPLGALWNLFILVGSVRALIRLFEDDYADTVVQMREALKHQPSKDRQPLDEFYEAADPIDFSHDVLEAQASRLQVIRVPSCGWTDLGTPQRVEATLRNMSANGGITTSNAGSNAALFFDLAV
jgi:mannose-1-phosphate guanylyltransferase